MLDRFSAGCEGGSSVRGRHGDDDAHLADLHPPDPVMDRELAQLVSAFQPVGKIGHHLLGHSLVRLVVEVEHVTAT
jgi:hypothetical protein